MEVCLHVVCADILIVVENIYTTEIITSCEVTRCMRLCMPRFFCNKSKAYCHSIICFIVSVFFTSQQLSLVCWIAYKCAQWTLLVSVLTGTHEATETETTLMQLYTHCSAGVLWRLHTCLCPEETVLCNVPTAHSPLPLVVPYGAPVYVCSLTACDTYITLAISALKGLLGCIKCQTIKHN